MAYDVDFSNVTDYIDLTYTEPTSFEAGDLYFDAEQTGDRLPQQALGWAGQKYAINLTNRIATSNIGVTGYHPCLGVIKLSDNCYTLIGGTTLNDGSMSGTYDGYSYSQDYSTYDTGAINFQRLNFGRIQQQYGVVNYNLLFERFENYGWFTFRSWDDFTDLLDTLVSDRSLLTNNILSWGDGPLGNEDNRGCLFAYGASGANLPFDMPTNTGNNSIFNHFEYQFKKTIIDTNIPIFLLNSEENYNAMQQWLVYGDENALAYAWDGSSPEVETDHQYFIYDSGYFYDVDDYDDITITSYFNKWVRFAKTTQKLCFYTTDGKEWYIKGYSGHDLTCQISTDQGQTWTTAIYDGQFEPFYLYSDGESVSVNRSGYQLTNIPISKGTEEYTSEELADHYIYTGEGMEDMDNFADILRGENLDPSKYEITTGDAITETELGLPQMSNYLMHQYIITDTSALRSIANILFNNTQSIIDDLLNATQLFSQNHMDCLIDFSYYPLDLLNLFTYTNTTTFNFGSYSTTLENGSLNVVGVPSGTLDCGSIKINPIFKDFRDFEPFCCMFIYLPYVGVHQLNIDRYINKDLNIQYAIDISSGACTAFLFADKILMDSFDGQIGVKRPLIARDQQAYSNAVLGNIKDAVTGGAGTIGEIAGAAANANPIGAAVGVGKGIAGIGGAVYNQTQITQQEPRMMRGGYTGCLGQYAPQSPILYFGVKASQKATSENAMMGYPSNASGVVRNFSGFLKCKTSQVTSATASAEEILMIKAALTEGIYI